MFEYCKCVIYRWNKIKLHNFTVWSCSVILLKINLLICSIFTFYLSIVLTFSLGLSIALLGVNVFILYSTQSIFILKTDHFSISACTLYNSKKNIKHIYILGVKVICVTFLILIWKFKEKKNLFLRALEEYFLLLHGFKQNDNSSPTKLFFILLLLNWPICKYTIE